MNMLYRLTLRNIKVFVKDRATLFFSLLSPLIILLLNLLFLRNMQINNLIFHAGDYVERAVLARIVDGYMFAGIISISCITVAFSCAMIRVKDSEIGSKDDLIVAPIKSYMIDISYWLAAFVITFLICLLVLISAFVFLIANGGSFSVMEIIIGILALFVATLSASAFVTFILRFFKTLNAASAFVGIISALGGFIIGAYMPVSTFALPVQNVMNSVPASHATAIFRNVFLTNAIGEVRELAGYQIADLITTNYDLSLNFFGGLANLSVQWIYLIVSIFVFVGLSVFIYYFKKSKKTSN
ncbi:MAG: ABC transporter permease [Erysipelotrichales bacterium]|nr:ABC transporter permease [Erysipelotrichales bacterium]